MPTATYTPGILGPLPSSLATGTSGGSGGINGATVTLYAAQAPADGALDITALLAPPSGTLITFSNTGRERLLVLPGAAAETVTVNIGTLILGQPVNSFPAVTMTAGHLYSFGPFRKALDEQGTNLVQVTLSGAASIQIALIRTAGVY